MLPTKFQLGEIFLEIDQPKTKIAYGSTEQEEMSNLSWGPFINMFPTKFQFIWLSGFRGEDFLEIHQPETNYFKPILYCLSMHHFAPSPLYVATSNFNSACLLKSYWIPWLWTASPKHWTEVCSTLVIP